MVLHNAISSIVGFRIVLLGLADELSESVQALVHADDICIWAARVTHVQVRTRVRRAATAVHNYLELCQLLLSAKKSLVPFARQRTEPYSVFINGEVIGVVHAYTCLGEVIY